VAVDEQEQKSSKMVIKCRNVIW